MKLLFKQRFLSWYDSYDIYDEMGNTVFVAKGQFAWGKTIAIYDALGSYVGTLKQKILRFLPTFELYRGNEFIGTIRKEFTFFKPVFHIDCNGWTVEGNYFEWDYRIFNAYGNVVATLSKEVWNWTDTYVIDVPDRENALTALMIVLAIDAEKDNRD